MILTEEQIKGLAPKETAFKAGKKLSTSDKWEQASVSDRALWGSIKGSGKNPYVLMIDTKNLAYKCTCPSRQFPCKHALGLLLKYSAESDAFPRDTEPEHVVEWLGKREERANKVDKEEKELTEEDKAKRDKAKAKRQDDRMILVNAGLNEIKTWLHDLIQIGLLELPSRTDTYFLDMEKRMVDSKIPGIAGWIRSLRMIDYRNQATWQEEALNIISKLYLLINAGEKLDQLEGVEKQHIQSLLGWTFKQKELMADEQTFTEKDKWLILGATTELQDDIKIHRYWLKGLQTGRDAIIIRFETRFSAGTIEVPLAVGSILEAELAFYPSTLPHRALIKKHKETVAFSTINFNGLKDWNDFIGIKNEQNKINPWTNNHCYVINNVRVTGDKKGLIIVDKNDHYYNVDSALDADKRSTLLLMANNEAMDIAFVESNNVITPLGIIQSEIYQAL